MSTTESNSDINVTLECEPALNYLPWRVSVENHAANKATIIAPTGLLTDILSDTQWDALLLNRSTSPGGTLTIAPRPVLPTHIPITMGMTNATISVAKYENDRHQTWHTAQESFKAALIRSLGPTLEGAIGPPPDGFKIISVRAIMDDVKGRYGKVDQVTLARMEEVLATPLDPVQNLEKHISTQKRHMLMQTSAGYPLEEYRKVQNFRKSVIAHHQIRECLSDYDKKFEDPLLHTYSAIINFVSTHLPNIRASAGLSSSATTGKAFQMTSTDSPSTAPKNMSMAEIISAYSALEH